MRKQNPFNLRDDELSDVITDYVFQQIPETEINSRIALEVDSMSITRKKPDGSFDDKPIRASGVFPIVTATDKFLRVHLLDNGLGLSKVGYRYYDKATEEGRISKRAYETALDRYGCRYFHMPNQIFLHEIPIKEIAKTRLRVQRQDSSSKTLVWHNRQLEITHKVHLKISATKEKLEISSYFCGVLDLFMYLDDLKN